MNILFVIIGAAWMMGFIEILLGINEDTQDPDSINIEVTGWNRSSNLGKITAIIFVIILAFVLAPIQIIIDIKSFF